MCAPAVKTHAASGDRSKLQLLSRRQRTLFQPEGLRDASAVCRIGPGAIGDMTLLDVQLGISHRTRRVLEKQLALMRQRLASINDLPIAESERKYHWPLGRRPDDHPSLSELGL